MLSSIFLVLIGATGVTALEVEALPCPNPVSAWTGTTDASVDCVAVNREGGLLVGGHFRDGADLDPTTGTDAHSAYGGADPYIIKVGVDGSYAWAYAVGGDVGWDATRGVAVAADRTIVLVGHFEGTVDFDPGPDTDEHTTPGEVATFITRLTADGGYLSTVTFRGPGRAIPGGLALDGDGNILVVGLYDGPIDFDPGSGTCVRSGVNNVYISKLGPDGSHQWTHTLGGDAFDSGDHVVVDSDDNVYVTGTFRGTLNFDPTGGIDEHSIVPPYEDVFVSKYHPDGSYGWTRTYDVDYPWDGRRIAVAHDDGLLLTGLFFDTVDFDPGEGVDRRTVHDAPDASLHGDIFVTKLDANGSYGWTYTVGGSSGDAGSAVDVDTLGNVLVIGHFQETVDFDPGVRFDIHESEWQEDVFIAKLSPDGLYQWTRTFGAERNDWGYHIRVDGHGGVYAVGSFRAYPPDNDFDPGCEVGTHPVHDDGASERFIMKLVCLERSADFDSNGLVDLRDAAEFQLCFTDEGPTTCGDGCSRLDLHPDDDIDLDDYTAFRKRLTGPQPRELITPTAPITTRRERPGDTSIRAPSVSAGCDK